MANRKLAVRVAKDIIAQIKAKKFIAQQGIYASLYFGERGTCFTKIPGKAEVKDLLDKGKVKECRVCALGSLVMSHIGLKDECTINQFVGNREDMPEATSYGTSGYSICSICIDNQHSRLESIFSPIELYLMEVCFEMADMGVYQDAFDTKDVLVSSGDVTIHNIIDQSGSKREKDRCRDYYISCRVKIEAAISYGYTEGYADDRLIMIMKNVIRNKGKFIIPKKYMREANSTVGKSLREEFAEALV